MLLSRNPATWLCFKATGFQLQACWNDDDSVTNTAHAVLSVYSAGLAFDPGHKNIASSYIFNYFRAKKTTL